MTIDREFRKGFRAGAMKAEAEHGARALERIATALEAIAKALEPPQYTVGPGSNYLFGVPLNLYPDNILNKYYSGDSGPAYNWSRSEKWLDDAAEQAAREDGSQL